MIKLRHRSHAKECIDDPQVDAGTLRQTYLQVKQINIYTLGYWPTMSAIKYFLARYPPVGKIKVLDIGCGDGETLRRIDAYARARHCPVALTGIDLNREVVLSARDLSGAGINFIHGDIFSIGQDESYDLIINSLTMHHLSDQQIIKLMQWMSLHAQKGWFVSDLHRHYIAYYFIKCFDKLCGFNHLVCHDAPLSVARGFRRNEWIDLLNQAGLDPGHFKISWYLNFRYGIRYEKPV
jgi:2-polyprenyl-3-methyl-5-hydroxy-6-metoxy-1,4-benzoquinol methylase